jgi:hypothetical protein
MTCNLTSLAPIVAVSAFDLEGSSYLLDFSDMRYTTTIKRANIAPNETANPMISALSDWPEINLPKTIAEVHGNRCVIQVVE